MKRRTLFPFSFFNKKKDIYPTCLSIVVTMFGYFGWSMVMFETINDTFAPVSVGHPSNCVKTTLWLAINSIFWNRKRNGRVPALIVL